MRQKRRTPEILLMPAAFSLPPQSLGGFLAQG